MNGRTNWYIRTMKYCSATKKNQLLTHATIRLNVKYIVCRERSQTWKATYCIMPFIWHPGIGKTCKSRKLTSGCQRLTRKGQEGSLGGEENILHHNWGDGYTIVHLSKFIELDAFKRLILLHVSCVTIILNGDKGKNDREWMSNK